MDLWPFIITFFIIAVAELGDKTQLLTLGFATRFPVWKVIGAVFAATAVLMAAAVFFGGALNLLIPEFYLQLAVGILFIGFGLWILLSKDEDEEKAKGKDNKNPFLLVFSSFLLAELGDKTQLAALSLAARYGTPIQIWAGATLGMAGVNIIAALAGSWIKRVVSARIIKTLAAAFFLVFGIITLWCLLVKC